MTRWTRLMNMWRRARGRQKEPVQIASLLRQVPGKWVALVNGDLVEVQETLDLLVRALKDRGIRNATVMRSPGEEEPLLVGLG